MAVPPRLRGPVRGHGRADAESGLITSPRRWRGLVVVMVLIGANVVIRGQGLTPWLDQNYPRVYDEWSYQTIGYLWSHHGVLPYRDIRSEDKTPGTMLLFRYTTQHWGTSMVVPRLLAVGAGTGTALLLLLVGGHLYGRTVGLAAAALWTLAAASPRMGTDGVLTEPFALPFAVAGWGAACLAARRGSVLWAAAAGVAFGCAFLFKQPWALEFAAAGLYLAVSPGVRRAAAVGGLLCGFALAMAGISVFYAHQGILADAWRVTLLGPLDLSGRAHLPLLERGYRATQCALGYFVPGVLWFGPMAIALPRLLSHRSRDAERLTLCWLVASGLAALAAGKLFPHQLLQFLPAACLAGGVGIVEFVAAANRLDRGQWTWLRGACILLGSWCAAVPVSESLAETTHQWARWVYLGEPAPPSPSSELAIADAVRSMSQPGDRVFVWGDSDFVYMLADRRPAARHLNAILARRSDAMKADIIASLRQTPPELIVWESMSGLHRSDRFPELEGLLANSYHLVRHVGGYCIYELGPLSAAR